MVKFENVTKKFGELTALNRVSFEIKEGEFVFIIGPCGAGKSTLVKLILREYLPTEGQVKVKNIDLKNLRKKKFPNTEKNWRCFSGF